jgi:hypothetical protein
MGHRGSEPNQRGTRRKKHNKIGQGIPAKDEQKAINDSTFQIIDQIRIVTGSV